MFGSSVPTSETLSSLTSFHETSRRNSPLWELLPSNLSWSPIGSRQSNLWSKQIWQLKRQYKCGARDNYVRIFSFMTDSCKMTSYCRICAGPIENPPDSHDHWIACLCLAHAEAALEESDCHNVRICHCACWGLARMWPVASSGLGPLPPTCR